MLKMKTLLFSAVLAAAPLAQAQDFYCPTPEYIKNLTQEASAQVSKQSELDEILKNSMYRLMKTGYSAQRTATTRASDHLGNIFDYNRAGVFVDGDDYGNREMLENYAALNASLFESFKEKEEHIIGDFNPAHTYNGTFKINYIFGSGNLSNGSDSASECRRQIIIGKQIHTEDGEMTASSVEVENGKPTGFFNGMTAVEICNPNIAGLFPRAKAAFSADIGEKVSALPQMKEQAALLQKSLHTLPVKEAEIAQAHLDQLQQAIGAASIYAAAKQAGLDLPGLKSWRHFKFFVKAATQGKMAEADALEKKYDEAKASGADQGTLTNIAMAASWAREQAAGLETMSSRLAQPRLTLDGDKSEVVMFAKDADGDIVPRFAVKLDRLYYAADTNNGNACELKVFHDDRAQGFADLITQNPFIQASSPGDYEFVMEMNTDSIEVSDQTLWYWASENGENVVESYNYVEVKK